MPAHPDLPAPPTSPTPARDRLRYLSHYRESNMRRSCFELAVTVGPFVALWALAW